MQAEMHIEPSPQTPVLEAELWQTERMSGLAPWRASRPARRALTLGTALGGSLLALVTLTVVAPSRAEAGRDTRPQTDAPTYAERDFLTRIRKVTVEGARAGEGYFTPDGRQMVFQSEREPGNPFYQIYTLDLTTGDSRRVSPGHGKTTCAFFRPGTLDILFASTHHDPRTRDLQKAELDFRASGQERRYAWDYDDQMDLYVASARDGALTRLTEARGYDAEASYSPDGAWIVFSSTRAAYAGTLSETDSARLAVDPSYFADLYRMRADGTDVQRLTETPGYDGGPFYTPDGRILWRRFDVDGLIADVWIMNADGTGARQVTDFGSMSWAPYMHPSGRYIFFASNKLGFDNFEVYIVDADGTKEPVRVTYTPGFDGLPVPTPDGATLAWTSGRSGPGAQIFFAQWNHQRALEALAAAPARRAPTR
jgi:Tol biopolymer transport system component